ncbi:MAG: hypothetical protein KAJ55_11520 [Anaerolineales bacterium]|nr:hypothetical protein [Anaerolineales bacterium]
MTPSEAVIELQNTYDKELTEFQTARYTRFLMKFTPADIEKIIEKSVEECRLLPKIASLNDAARDLLVQRPDRRRGPDRDCKVCDGTGWKYVKVFYSETKQEVQAVEHCGCEADPGPGGVF